MELAVDVISSLSHPLVAGSLGFLLGILAGFRLGLLRHRFDRLNDTMTRLRGEILRQLDHGPRADTTWLSSADRDHILTELPWWRRVRFSRAWASYCEEHQRQRYQHSAIFLLRDPAPVAATLKELRHTMRPI